MPHSIVAVARAVFAGVAPLPSFGSLKMLRFGSKAVANGSLRAHALPECDVTGVSKKVSTHFVTVWRDVSQKHVNTIWFRDQGSDLGTPHS